MHGNLGIQCKSDGMRDDNDFKQATLQSHLHIGDGKVYRAKAVSPEKATSVLSISLSEVHAVLNKQEIPTKTRHSLMRVAATLQYYTPKAARHTRHMPEEAPAVQRTRFVVTLRMKKMTPWRQ